MNTSTMTAIVVEHGGPPEVLQIRQIPRPVARDGWLLIRVRAFGLNRSEMFTRQGHSGSAVQFPRVLGIECVGEVAAAPNSDLQPGQKVAALMGGMGRAFDGGYAEYTLVPRSQVIPVQTTLSWTQLAALPETFFTAWGSLIEAMEVKAGQTLLVRGGTSSVGMAAITIAKELGLTIIATTRNQAKRQTLLVNGANHVIIDNGQIAEQVRYLFPGGVDAVLELVGAKTLRDSLQAAAARGIVCNTGILGNQWILEAFEPLTEIPSTVKLTVFTSDMNFTLSAEVFQNIVNRVEAGDYHPNLDRVFDFDEIVAAHHYMEANRASGKLVVRGLP